MPENSLPGKGEDDGWLSGTPSRLAQSGKNACVQCWIYLTFLRLARAGAKVELCHTIPEKGIVIALTGNLMKEFSPSEGVYLIGVVADGMPHPSCHFHILQNPAHAARLPRSTYIPLWPQPGLIPRSAERGDRFENLCFYGDPPNLAPELRATTFSEMLKNRFQLNFVIAGSDHWHDYSEADCVLAIREFGSKSFLRKPATKLYNSWLAGAPFIGGADSAFADDGRRNIDYIACHSLDDVLGAIMNLRDDLSFRRSLVKEGSLAARNFSTEAVTRRWMDFLGSLSKIRNSSTLRHPMSVKVLNRWRQHLSLTCDRLKGGY